MRARLKHEMRAALSRAGLPGPDYRVFSVHDDPEALADELSYPAVIKPVFLSGSRGVVRVDDGEAFARWFLWLRELLAEEEIARRGGADAERVLVEDFVPGDEVAVEALLADGVLHRLALFDKPDPLDGRPSRRRSTSPLRGTRGKSARRSRRRPRAPRARSACGTGRSTRSYGCLPPARSILRRSVGSRS